EVMDLIRGNTNASGAKWDSKVGYGTIDMGKTLNEAKKAGESKPAVTTTSAAATTTKATTTTTAKSTTTKATTTTTAKSTTTKAATTTTAKSTTTAKVATEAAATAATFPTMAAATAPAMVKVQGLNYNFNGSGKAVSTVTHKDVMVDVERLMFLSVTSLDKNMTIDVEVKNRENGTVAHKGTYSAVNSDVGFEADAGVYDVNVTITAANGNSKYAIRLVAPEFFVMEENPVPLGVLAFGDSSDTSGIHKSDIMCGVAVAVMAIATIIVGVASAKKRRR
ncbi:MAG: hypothetical protein FWF82_05830, partial [Oscillospiraceae bacterium]|nr:hypothetical protein [Oscillospiraceae bacterium]